MTDQYLSRYRAASRLTDIDTSIEQYEREAERLAAEGDYAALGAGLGRLRGLRQALTALERHVEDLTVDLLPRKRTEIEGLVMERRSSTTRRQWQHDELLTELWNASFADLNGEADPDGQSERFLAAVKECLRPEWRVTPLRNRNIPIDEFCEETPGRTTVQVYQKQEEPDA